MKKNSPFAVDRGTKVGKARVMAAAPDLLAALKGFVAAMDGISPSADETPLVVWDSYHVACAAIAKAEGKHGELGKIRSQFLTKEL